MSFNWPPKTWAFCNGQQLPINQNQALFALLGTTYGGNGQTTFALPDFRARVPIHMSNTHHLGESAGSEAVTVTQQQMPQHLHFMQGTESNGALSDPTGAIPGRVNNLYTSPANLVTMHPASVSTVGGSQPHTNLQPYLAVSFCIALQGIFPTRA